MKINTIYKKIGHDRREYRKYTPWIFFILEAILVFEILYTMDFFVVLGNIFIIGFLGVMYFRLNKLFYILDRQRKLKNKPALRKEIKPSQY